MTRASIRIEGHIGEPRPAATKSGKSVLNVSIAHTPRKLNEQTKEWEDAGATLWAAFTVWENDIARYQDVLVKGAKVTVEGIPELNVYQSKDGTTGANINIRNARIVGVPQLPKNSQQYGAPQGAAPQGVAPQGGYQPPQQRPQAPASWGEPPVDDAWASDVPF